VYDASIESTDRVGNFAYRLQQVVIESSGPLRNRIDPLSDSNGFKSQIGMH